MAEDAASAAWDALCAAWERCCAQSQEIMTAEQSAAMVPHVQSVREGIRAVLAAAQHLRDQDTALADDALKMAK